MGNVKNPLTTDEVLMGKSTNKIKMFEGHEVEMIEINGWVLFNPKDVADILGISDVNGSIRNFNKNQIVKVKNSDVHNLHIRKLNNVGDKKNWRLQNKEPGRV